MDKASKTEKKCAEYTQIQAHDTGLAIQWADWKEFTNIKKIGEGGFGTVYSSRWSRSIEIVALKTIGKPNELMNNFLKEAKALFRCYNQENSCFRIKGFTQDPLSMQYYIITRYAENGDLR
ncbi:unnamed protein product [Rhizophagus irregularis]|uniref:Protein kinase domain-containing protein n=1 Tax=Rhizophagus irregularis TaxID=588596 RepID=A0A915YVV6_9GLOM|nr:unnamed protein product [Rhizophagus irregularis]